MEEFFRYWGRIVLPIVLKRSIGGSGMKLAFWVFIISGFVSVLLIILFLFNRASTDIVDFTVEQYKNYAFALGISILIAFFSFGGLLLSVPPEINKTKENKINELYNELNSVTPDIQVAGAIDIRDVLIGHPENGVYTLSHICVLASIPFSNSPTFANQFNNAKNVRAELDFLDEDGEMILACIQGRWQGLQPNEINTSDRTSLESINIPNNGAKRWLDLVMKYPEDEFCYAYNNDSYGIGYFTHPNLLVSSKRFFIRIRLKGEYISGNVFDIEVETKGKGDSFQIRQGGKWLKLKNSQATKTPNQQTEKKQKKKSSLRKTSSKR